MWWLSLLIPTGIVILLFLVLISPRLIGRPDMTHLQGDYAHRGLHSEEIPENSLPAFALATEQRFGIELDVQLSSDGVIMVFHDDTLIRMTGVQGKLCEYSREQLQQMHLAGSGEVIPTLDEVLETVGGRVPLLIELKGESAGGAAALCESICARLDRYDGPYCVESFNPVILSWFRKHRPDIVRGQLVTNTCKERPNGNPILNFLLTHLMLNVISRPDFVAYNEKYAREWVLWLNTHLLGAVPFVWTVRDRGLWETVHALRINTIFEGFMPDMPTKENDHA